jgi:predicted Zn-dependent protease
MSDSSGLACDWRSDVELSTGVRLSVPVPFFRAQAQRPALFCLSFGMASWKAATYNQATMMASLTKSMGVLWFVRAAILAATTLCVLSTFAQSGDLAAKSQRAKEFMADGKFAEAIPLYRELNQAVPNNAGLMLNLGMALHMAGEDRKAIPPLQTAVKLDTSLAPAWLFLGAAHLELGELQAGVKALRAVLRLEPGHRDARLMLGDTLLSLGQPEDAAEQYRNLTESDPGSSHGWYGRGRAYESLSAQAFDELQKAAPGSAYWLALVAETRVRERQFSSAFYLYRGALQKMPGMRGLHESVAEIYRETGHADWANAEQEKERQLAPPDCKADVLECQFRAARYADLVALHESPHEARTYYWRSRAYNELALEAFTRLGQLPPSAEQHELKAHIYNNQKKYAEAVEEWRAALKFSPEDTRLQKQLAMNLKFSQSYDQALPVFQELLRKQPASAELNYLTGDTLLDLQRTEEAIPLLKTAVGLDPKLMGAHKSLARADLAAGKATEAIPHLKAALLTDTDGSLHYQLARAYQATSHPDLAKSMLEEYQKIQRAAASEIEAAQREVEITPP